MASTPQHVAELERGQDGNEEAHTGREPAVRRWRILLCRGAVPTAGADENRGGERQCHQRDRDCKSTEPIHAQPGREKYRTEQGERGADPRQCRALGVQSSTVHSSAGQNRHHDDGGHHDQPECQQRRQRGGRQGPGLPKRPLGTCPPCEGRAARGRTENDERGDQHPPSTVGRGDVETLERDAGSEQRKSGSDPRQERALVCEAETGIGFVADTVDLLRPPRPRWIALAAAQRGTSWSDRRCRPGMGGPGTPPLSRAAPG